MGTKSTIIKQKIKQKGHFNFGDLYSAAFEHLTDEDYIVSEEEYAEKITAGGKDIEIIWSAFKNVTDYIKFTIGVTWKIQGLSDVEAEQDGKKVKTNKGTVEIVVKSIIETDYDKKWENTPFWKFMRGMYDKYIIKNTVEQYIGDLVGETMGFVNETKSFLNMTK